jgi:ATPase subunit of ABC transporter with duplicated ATPase domains
MLKLKLPEPRLKTDTAVIKLNSVSFSFDEKNVLNDIDLGLYLGSYYCIIGNNGEGKSTLLKLLDETLIPKTGYVEKLDKVKVARYHH